MKKFLKRIRADKGDSSIISFVLLAGLFVVMIFSFIDYSIYLSDRSIMHGAVQDSARTVAIMGGNGTATMATPIEAQYGTSLATACSGLSTNPRVKQALTSTTTVDECEGLQTYATTSNLVSVTITSFVCTPQMTTSVGQVVTCTSKWSYGGIPGSALGLIRKTSSTGQSVALFDDNTSVATSQSEVAYTSAQSLVNRPV